MSNQVIIVGRLVQDPQTKELENELKTSYITLAVQRNYKNSEGIYETDLIPCVLYKCIAENTVKYCKKGDLVGIKGRLQTRKEKETAVIEIVAERVTFLSSRKENEEE